MSIYEMADKIGEMSHVTTPRPIERAKMVPAQVNRLRNPNQWPPEVWAEMQAIYAGEIE